MDLIQIRQVLVVWLQEIAWQLAQRNPKPGGGSWSGKAEYIASVNEGVGEGEGKA